MSSALLELQKEVTQPDCDIVSVLRRAQLLASKLGLKDFNQWIVNELNGYSTQNDAPEYRTVPGQLKAFDPHNGWIPVMLNEPELEDIICHPKMINSISEIVSLCNNNNSKIIIPIPSEAQTTINEMCNNPFPMQMALHVSKTATADIIERVKNTLIDWTLELEKKGILGENMSFSEQGKENAKSIPQQVNNYYGATNVINGSIEKLQANAGNTINAFFDYDIAKNAVDEIDNSIQKNENLSPEDKEEALELLRDIHNKIETKKKGAVIKASFVALKDFLISVGAGLTVELIKAKMQGLF